MVIGFVEVVRKVGFWVGRVFWVVCKEIFGYGGNLFWSYVFWCWKIVGFVFYWGVDIVRRWFVSCEVGVWGFFGFV